MENKKSNKGLTVLLIILVIFLCVYLGYIFMQDRNSAKNETNTNAQENMVANNIQKNTTNTSNETNNTNKETQQTQNTNTQNSVENDGPEVVGQEEEESNQETGGINPEEKAINLAKQKWGQNSDAYIFKVDYVEGDIYHVAVVSNAMIISYMDVNIKTEEVTEY